MLEIFTDILNIIATVSCAISGALVATQKKMDIFGVAILGLAGATGGGLMRDILIGNLPPQMMIIPTYAIIALAVSVIIFIPPIRSRVKKRQETFDWILFSMDTLGLATFSVIGISVTKATVPEYSTFLLIFIGTLNGVGGSLLRDIMAGDTPFIFIKDFYACASIIGSAACVVLWNFTDGKIAMSVGAFLIVVLRIFAVKFHWKLPKA